MAKAQPYKPDPDRPGVSVECSPEEAAVICYLCPCGSAHEVPVRGGGAWKWNRDTERPTLHPSIKAEARGEGYCCHHWLLEGTLEFCGDSSHGHAGKKVKLEDWEG